MNGKDIKRRHVEAYCLMKYCADDGTEEERIWNSRDGVTPFVISLRSGKTAQHVNWHQDKYMPYYIPQVGERIFVDLTMPRALEMAQRMLDRYRALEADDPDISAYVKEIPTATELALAYIMEPGAPDLIEVTEALHEFYVGFNGRHHELS